MVVTQDFDWPTLSNVTHEMARNHCLSMIEMSKVASVCVNVTGMADVLDLCIMEVKVKLQYFYQPDVTVVLLCISFI